MHAQNDVLIDYRKVLNPQSFRTTTEARVSLFDLEFNLIEQGRRRLFQQKAEFCSSKNKCNGSSKPPKRVWRLMTMITESHPGFYCCDFGISTLKLCHELFGYEYRGHKKPEYDTVIVLDCGIADYFFCGGSWP